jgi:NAD(P)-dependent dehydrogenase (short-subunit alcohol dehydrogenase family)
MHPSTTVLETTNASLSGKVAVVTGGGQGLGQAIVQVLAEAGATVVIGDVDAKRAEETAASLNEHRHGQSSEVRTFLLDVADDESVDRFFEHLNNEFGRLDFLINSAGIDVTKPIEEMRMDEWDRVMDVNLRGPVLMAKKAATMMYPAQSGHIVNIISTAAKRAWPNASVYHASKWGLLGFSRGLFTEARQHNVKVTAVVPGGMRTGFILDRFPEVDIDTLQEPSSVARSVLHVLTSPAESVIPEIMVLPLQETSWP